MPLPSRQEILYLQIMEDLRHNYAPGAIPPTEMKYAAQFSCSHTTLRKILERLQEAKKILRTHSGTFVLDETTGKSPSHTEHKDAPVHLLLPCAHYPEAIDKASRAMTNIFFSGVMRGIVECGRRFVTIPISETNLDNSLECIDIAWTQFAGRRRNDEVIFLGRRYRKIIPLLILRECRFITISQMTEPFTDSPLESGYFGCSNIAFMTYALVCAQRAPW